jgi:[NiFe] hydrogenase diaphorase moiety large subunit
MPEQSTREAVLAQLRRWRNDPANLLQMLIGLQRTLRHVPDEAVDLLGAELGVSRAQIEGVVGFYSFLHRTPRGEFDLLISDNIVDRMQGSREIADYLAGHLRISPGVTRADGRVSLGFTSCTGMSDQGPAALVNGHALPRLDRERADRVLALIEAGTPLADWPDDLFQVEDNIQRRDLLLASALESGAALRAALARGADAILDQLETSGLRGRGGAGFRTALKWRYCRDTANPERVVVCNADEGEPGTFKDRVLLQSYADRLIEGMTLCALVIGARQGFIYLRGEYLYLLDDIERALQQARDQHLLGRDILGQAGLEFDILVHLGAGAYVCGEESALIESLEGKRGDPRIRPPFPVEQGYLGRPTVVNNVETFIAAAMIAVYGAAWFRRRGTEQSAGTKLLSVSGDCARPGIYEVPFGIRIQEVLDDCGACAVQAVQLAGPAGHLLPPLDFQHRIAYENVATGGSFMVFGQGRDLLEVARNFTDFFVHESCGFCTPCRVGGALLKKAVDKLAAGRASGADLEGMRRLGALMRTASHCGLGATASNPALDLLKNFPEVAEGRLRDPGFAPSFDLDAALEEARALTGRTDPGAHLQGANP